MTSLITGNRGFVGKHLERFLNSRGLSTAGFDVLNDYPTVEVLVDFLKQNSVKEVYHLGARPFIPDCYGMEMGVVVNSNVVFTANLLMACKKANVKKMVYMSTSEVYGNAKTLPINEDTPVNPLSTYAATKLAAENLVRTFRDETGFDARILRHFNIYGPDDTHPRIIPKIMSAAKNEKILKLGALDITRDFSYVTDACEALFNIMSLKEPDDFVKGEGCQWSIKSLIDLISKMYNTDILVEIERSLIRPNDVLRLQADYSKYYYRFPNHQSLTLPEGLLLTKEWYDKNEWKWERNGKTTK